MVEVCWVQRSLRHLPGFGCRTQMVEIGRAVYRGRGEGSTLLVDCSEVKPVSKPILCFVTL